MAKGKIFKIIGYVAGISLAVVLLLAMLEGLSSFALLSQQIGQLAGVSRSDSIIQYDPDLGVIYQPNLNLPDFYAPGVGFETNSQSYRAKRDYAHQVPPGKSRILCMGDSFTVGEGVRFEETWCNRLEQVSPSLQTLNMGHGGYGADQAYLRYMRDGGRFEHQIVIFAFVANDFLRMDLKLIKGARKPFLTLENNELKILNQPVPRFDKRGLMKWINPQVLYNLRLVELLRMVFGRLIPAESAGGELLDSTVPSLVVAFKAFETMQQRAAENNVLAIYVYLPTREDYFIRKTQKLREFLNNEFARRRMLYLDMTDALLEKPAQEVRGYFLSEKDVPNARFAARHYSASGHRFALEQIYGFLTAIREQAMERMQQSPAPSGP